ncbi:MAG TPA: site-specific integrase [Sphingomicrobium sp.]|nr:site-specific integrase [Sphingomicrobium sp.]
MPLKLVEGRHGSPYWYVRGSVRGLRVDESTGCTRKEDAEAVRIRREAELLDRSIHGDSAARTLSQAIVSYLDAGGDGTHLDPILVHFGPKAKVGSIGQAEIDECAAKLLPKGSPATWNRKIYTPLSAVLHHAARKKWCAKPVIARPKGHDKERIRWITHEEAERLIAAGASHIKPLVIFLLSTGARLSEALYLEWSDLDLTRAHVVFRPTDARGIKTDEARGVPLPPRAVAALANLEWDRKGFVFRRPAGKIRKSGRVWLPYESRDGAGGGQIKTAWAGMLKRAGVSDFTPHDCRHTWATWHYMANRDVGALMTLGGWKSPSMVFRYTHINAAHLAPSQALLWGIDGEQDAGASAKTASDKKKA